MPLPDYSKFKADIKKPKKSEVRKGKISSLEADLAGLMDEESARSGQRGRTSSAMGYDMGYLDVSETNNNKPANIVGGTNMNDMSVSMLNNGSTTSLGDPFYDDEEEVSVTENYDEEDEDDEEDWGGGDDESNNLNNNSRVSIQSGEMAGKRTKRRGKNKEDPRMNKSCSDASIGRTRKFPENHTRRSLRDSSPAAAGRRSTMGDGTSRSVDSASSKKSNASLDKFLDKSNKRGRKKTALLPGSRTEDLRSEMNEVVSLMSAKRSGASRSVGGSVRSSSRDSGTGGGFRSRSSDRVDSGTGPPPLRRSITDDGTGGGKLRDYSQPGTTSSRLRDYSVRSSGNAGPSAERGGKRTGPRRHASHDGTGGSNIRRSRSEDETGGGGGGRRTLPPKSKSMDGSQRNLGGVRSSNNTDPKNLYGSSSGCITSHTHQSFVTGSRIRRITPGGGGCADHHHHGGGSNLGGSFSSFQNSTSNLSRDGSFRGIQRDVSPAPRRQKQRSVSPTSKSGGKKHRSVSPSSGKKHSKSSSSGTTKERKETKKKKERVKDIEVPPLMFS